MRDKAIVDEHLLSYTAFSIDTKELSGYLYENEGSGQFRLHVDENLDWTIDIELNDLKSADYKATYTNGKKTFELEEQFLVNTFKGKTSDGQTVRFTIDENSFFGVILGDTYHYVIRPLKDYTQKREETNFIVYKSFDIILDDSETDFINDALEVPKDGRNVLMNFGLTDSTNQLTLSRSCPNYYLNIATDADYQFYQARGNNMLAVNNYILGILNIAEGVYESTFGIKFIVTFQNVYYTNSQPYTSNDAGTLIGEFRDHWNSNHTNVVRNVAHLFTGKNLNALGVGYLGDVNGNSANNFAYAVTKNDNYMQYTTTHEIGHNLNAIHPSASNCDCSSSNARSVMCTGSNITNLWFCQQSINEISIFSYNNRSLLIGICGLNTICLTVGSYSLLNGTNANWSVSGNLQFDTNSTTNINSVTVKPLTYDGKGGTLTAVVNGISYSKIIYACNNPIVGQEDFCPSGIFGMAWGNIASWSVSNGFSVSSPNLNNNVIVTANSPYTYQTGTIYATVNGVTMSKSFTACAPITGPSEICGEGTYFLNVPGATGTNWQVQPSQFFDIIYSDNTSVIVRMDTQSAFTGLVGTVIAVYNNGQQSSNKSFTVKCAKGGGDEPPKGYVTVYPNPADNVLTVEIDEEAAAEIRAAQQGGVISKISPTYNIRMHNAVGDVVRSEKTKNNRVEFDVSTLQKGFYIVNVSDGIIIEPEIHKVVVNH